MRLAVKFGIIDVDGLANSLTNEQIEEFEALAIIDGWHNGWTQVAELMATIINESSRQIITHATNPDQAMNSIKWKSGIQIANQMTDYHAKKVTTMSVDQMAQSARARYGN